VHYEWTLTYDDSLSQTLARLARTKMRGSAFGAVNREGEQKKREERKKSCTRAETDGRGSNVAAWDGLADELVPRTSIRTTQRVLQTVHTLFECLSRRAGGGRRIRFAALRLSEQKANCERFCRCTGSTVLGPSASSRYVVPMGMLHGSVRPSRG